MYQIKSDKPIYKTTLGKDITIAWLSIYENKVPLHPFRFLNTYDVVIHMGSKETDGVSITNCESFESAKHRGINLWRTLSDGIERAYHTGFSKGVDTVILELTEKGME